MAQQARAKRRPVKGQPAASSLGSKIPWGRLGADALGFALLALGLTSLLSTLRAEGAVAGPLGRFLGLTFGWLAPGAALWLGALGLILIAQRIVPRPWPWKEL